MQKPNDSLHAAIQKKCSIDTLQNIINKKVDINSLNAHQESPLLQATHDFWEQSTYKQTVIIWLLNNKANPNIQNKAGHTALYILASQTVYNSAILDVVKHLLNHNADPNIPTPLTQQTPLHQTISPDLIKLLIHEKANPLLKNKSGNPALGLGILYVMLLSKASRTFAEQIISDLPIDITEKINGKSLLDYEKENNSNQVINLHRTGNFGHEKEKILMFLLSVKWLHKKIKLIIPKPIIQKILVDHACIPAFGKSVPFFI